MSYRTGRTERDNVMDGEDNYGDDSGAPLRRTEEWEFLSTQKSELGEESQGLTNLGTKGEILSTTILAEQ